MNIEHYLITKMGENKPWYKIDTPKYVIRIKCVDNPNIYR